MGYKQSDLIWIKGRYLSGTALTTRWSIVYVGSGVPRKQTAPVLWGHPNPSSQLQAQPYFSFMNRMPAASTMVTALAATKGASPESRP